MIFIVTPAESVPRHGYYLESWGRPVARRVRLVAYEQLAEIRRFAPGTYVFTALEALSDEQLALASALRDQLMAGGPRFRLLNDPRAVLRRFELLRTLYAAGEKTVNAYRVSDREKPARFPVFLRLENAHTGSLTPLLHDARELAGAVRSLQRQGVDRTKLLIMEFCDTRDDEGLYRVRAVFRVGDRVFAHHLHVGPEWLVKNSYSSRDRAHAAEEMAFLRSGESKRLRRYFDLARIDFGRVDYALRGDEIEVWEINTNPVILRNPGRGISPERMPGVRLVARRMRSALEAIDLDASGAGVAGRWDRFPVPSPALQPLAV